MRQLFLDCDGVLADFDGLSKQLFHKDSRIAEEELGTEEFWRQIQAHCSS